MDRCDQRKITRNLVVIKERVEEDLDFIIDRFIERDILSIQSKEEIDNAQPPTPQKKTTLFINKLLRSGKHSYPAFKDILLQRGYEDVVDLLENTRPEKASSEGASGWSEEKSKTFIIPSLVDETDGSTVGDQRLATEEMECMLTIVMSKFEEKESKIKAELREEFEKKLNTDRKNHEDTITIFKENLSKVAKISEEYKYLKTIQKSLRKQLGDQHEKIVTLNRENIALKKQVTKLDALKEENTLLKAENENLKRESTKIETEMKKLQGHIEDKENEIDDLKKHIEFQYNRLKSDLSNTRDKFDNDRGSLHADMQKQHTMLSEISKAVFNITKTIEADSEESNKFRGSQVRTPRPRNMPWIPKKSTEKSSYRRHMGYQTWK